MITVTQQEYFDFIIASKEKLQKDLANFKVLESLFRNYVEQLAHRPWYIPGYHFQNRLILT